MSRRAFSPEVFAERVRERMAELSLSVRKLGALIDTKPTVVQSWRSGTKPHEDNLRTLADALETTPEYLTGEDDWVPPDEGMAIDIVTRLKRIESAVAAAQSPGYLPLPSTPLQPAPTGLGHPTVELRAGLGAEVDLLDSALIAPEFLSDEYVLGQVRGESMAPTILSGAIVILQLYRPAVELPPVEEGRQTPWARFQARVPSGSIVVAAIGDDGPTLKRIRYRQAPADSSAEWVLDLLADNAEWAQANGFPYFAKASDHVRVYARAVAIGRQK